MRPKHFLMEFIVGIDGQTNTPMLKLTFVSLSPVSVMASQALGCTDLRTDALIEDTSKNQAGYVTPDTADNR